MCYFSRQHGNIAHLLLVVYGMWPYCGTFNSIDDCGHWIELGLTLFHPLSNHVLQMNVNLSFMVEIQMRKV